MMITMMMHDGDEDDDDYYKCNGVDYQVLMIIMILKKHINNDYIN